MDIISDITYSSKSVNTLVVITLFSLPELLDSQGGLIVGHGLWSVVVLVGVVVHNVQTPSLKPLGQSQSNFMWSILRKGEPKFV